MQRVANLKFKFPQVAWQHTLDVVSYITWVLCRIYSFFQR